MKVQELFEDFQSLDDWKVAVKKRYPEYAERMRFLGRHENGKSLVSAEVHGIDRAFGVYDMDAEKGEVLGEQTLAEKRPAGAPKWKDSDAPDANGKFKELGINDLADWLIKTRGGDMQKINGSLQQQIVFNRKKNPSYAAKMEKVREAVKRKLKKD